MVQRFVICLLAAYHRNCNKLCYLNNAHLLLLSVPIPYECNTKEMINGSSSIIH